MSKNDRKVARKNAGGKKKQLKEGVESIDELLASTNELVAESLKEGEKYLRFANKTLDDMKEEGNGKLRHFVDDVITEVSEHRLTYDTVVKEGVTLSNLLKGTCTESEAFEHHLALGENVAKMNELHTEVHDTMSPMYILLSGDTN